ncbi:MAG: isoprenyl synthetase [Bacteroidetes bacterium HGW-Bacteroidetes-21]|jgi:geranylgeranyl diphosphate synthase type II|nr:MAG: isoprenyl synthetase [Bacteroidetes bacterium HGW-Bacteroidetes-21]
MLSLTKSSEIIRQEIERLQTIPFSPVSLYEPVKYIMSGGGKRIRPSLCLFSCSIFSKAYKKALRPAVGIEILHNFTLVHDDIMDKSDFRRNKATVHKKWDINTAILSGDVMMFLATEYFNDLPASTYHLVLPFFAATSRKICEGQQMDMDFETSSNIKLSDYIEMIRLKTAELLAASLYIGAIIGGADKKQAIALYNYGIFAGIAFQLRDDYLDVYGNVEEFGKPVGNDIINRKKTFLYLSALEQSNKTDKTFLQKAYSENNSIDKKVVGQITSIYNKLNIPGLTDNEITHYHTKAIQVIKKAGIPDKAVTLLQNFSEKLTQRVV